MDGPKLFSRLLASAAGPGLGAGIRAFRAWCRAIGAPGLAPERRPRVPRPPGQGFRSRDLERQGGDGRGQERLGCCRFAVQDSASMPRNHFMPSWVSANQAIALNIPNRHHPRCKRVAVLAAWL